MPDQVHRHVSLCVSSPSPPSPQMRVYKLLQSTSYLLQNALPLPEAFFVGSIWFYYLWAAAVRALLSIRKLVVQNL